MLELDKETKINLIISRFIEIFILNLILSVIVAALSSFQLVQNQWTMIAALSVTLVVFNVINVGRYRWSYAHLENEKDYYVINIIAYLIFALINVVCIFILPNAAYTWIFLTTKLERFVLYGVVDVNSFWRGLLFSSIIFHMVGIGAIFCAPFGLDWVSDDEPPEDLKELVIEDETVNNDKTC